MAALRGGSLAAAHAKYIKPCPYVRVDESGCGSACAANQHSLEPHATTLQHSTHRLTCCQGGMVAGAACDKHDAAAAADNVTRLNQTT